MASFVLALVLTTSLTTLQRGYADLETARNIEIVVWKLSNNRSRGGELFLLSNEAAGSVVNLSFEREFGKMIASLDILSKIVSDKSGRTLIKVMQSLATAVFLPIK